MSTQWITGTDTGLAMIDLRLPHVIVAEDERLIAVAMEFALSVAGFRVSLAADGQEALEIDARDPADLVLTDIRMPRLDGFALIVSLRVRRPNLPVVVVTGTPADADRWVAPTSILMLLKPVSPTQVIVAAREALSTSR